MLLLNNFFEHPSVVAGISERSIDFTLDKADPRLNTLQKEYLFRHMGVSVEELAWLKQVHGEEVIKVDEFFCRHDSLQEADALITNVPEVPLGVRSADCLPIFLFDPRKKAIGLVHAGWKGSQKQIVHITCQRMQQEYATEYEDILAVLGPAIRVCCYQVGREFENYFPEEALQRRDGLYLDLIKVNRLQLLDLGLSRAQIFDCRVCTFCDERFFSFRREKEKAGRMLSFMMLKIL